MLAAAKAQKATFSPLPMCLFTDTRFSAYVTPMDHNRQEEIRDANRAIGSTVKCQLFCFCYTSTQWNRTGLLNVVTLFIPPNKTYASNIFIESFPDRLDIWVSAVFSSYPHIFQRVSQPHDFCL